VSLLKHRGNRSIAYGYDKASNRTSMPDPSNGQTTYTYDTLNRLTNLYDFNNNNFGLGYDALSRRTQLVRPSGLNTSYTYDSLSNLLSVLHQQGHQHFGWRDLYIRLCRESHLQNQSPQWGRFEFLLRQYLPTDRRDRTKPRIVHLRFCREPADLARCLELRLQQLKTSSPQPDQQLILTTITATPVRRPIRPEQPPIRGTLIIG